MTTANNVRPTDLELLERVRQGEHAVFGELWHRYQGWAHHVARSTTSRYDAQDIVQEAFAKVLSSLRNGNGPMLGFAHYLRTAIRNVAATWGARDSRATVVPFNEDTAVGSYEFEVTDLGELEKPFRSLPARWQRVLILTSLQDLPMAAVAADLGMTVGAATALAARARRGLRLALARNCDEFVLAA
ncbi:sigma-70 family RNA polymerase sigma factor [Leifsonia sp. fls2-241-R2A-40a]|uniref:RNA polymerase sigma factor n=1 Tax=Leifsonia sp. fls2-241-R2A-40a TaxID=3040290 RepID=UPI0025513E77|nr:sigma-70 family RNA polymerase sigma factor [Leifsonia sp. fls2-241-R2A-40a]